jgi:hypothetical protein
MKHMYGFPSIQVLCLFSPQRTDIQQIQNTADGGSEDMNGVKSSRTRTVTCRSMSDAVGIQHWKA